MSDSTTGQQGPDDAPVMVYAEPKRRRRGGWVIVLAVIAALVIAAVVLIVQLQRTGADQPASATASATPTASPSAPTSAPASPTASAPAPTDPAATEPPAPEQTEPPGTPPVIETPDAGAFRDAVGPRLNDALTGVRMLGGLSGSDAVTVVDQLTQDAMVLSDTIAPTAIGADWRAGAADYIAKLNALRGAYSASGDTTAALAAAKSAAESLRSLAGL